MKFGKRGFYKKCLCENCRNQDFQDSMIRGFILIIKRNHTDNQLIIDIFETLK
jgi:hypothetical protein